MNSETPGFFYKPDNIKRILRVFYVCCAALLLLDLVIHRHVEHPWERLIGFYPLYGFIGCVVLVLAAKAMRKLLMRDEHFYEREPQVRDLVTDKTDEPHVDH
ncbi:hypothetical protein G8764_04220 [Pseudomaricurvus alcaniphilus]|uniref:hypothetical protein n=1 Tax=Pseudomaricurvus alcaniphilus TaxID=1166482 RepID=UPI00140AC670|nr:hypothetical protein [Pseudomaricurvus alcaniphilus]NHN36495.1 hypothetical protein [Pseudomaricurvus alcaniphilus]